MWLFIPYYLKQFVWCRCVFYRERGGWREVSLDALLHPSLPPSSSLPPPPPSSCVAGGAAL